MRIYKILPRAEWEAARAIGRFHGSPADTRDGFIHFSTGKQAQETARRHFKDVADLVVLEVESDEFIIGLKWEPSRGGELFPHLYGAMSAMAVLAVHEAPLDADGIPQLGELS